MNEISFDDKFESVWCRECRENFEVIKQPVVYIDITKKKKMKQYSFKYAEPSVNNISTFCQVADQLLQQNIERQFFIPPLVERGPYCNHLVRSHFRNGYISFYWKK